MKTLRGKDYAISEIKVSSVNGQAFLPSDNKEENHFIYWSDIRLS